MRIRKEFQVIPTNALLENGHSTSSTNGYTAEYINNHSVVVSPTEPTGSARKKVWKQHSENLFNKSTELVGILINGQTGEFITNANWNTSALIKVNSNESVTISLDTEINSQLLIEEYTSSNTHIKQNFFSFSTGTKYKQYTITTGSTTGYVRIGYRADLTTGNIMFSKSSNWEEYEPYVNDKEYILNDNDIYEEFNENIIERYNQELTVNTTYTNSANATFYKNGKVIDCSLSISLKSSSGNPAIYWKLAEGLQFKPLGEMFLNGLVLQSNDSVTSAYFVIQLKSNGDIYLKTTAGYSDNYKINLNFTYLTND